MIGRENSKEDSILTPEARNKDHKLGLIVAVAIIIFIVLALSFSDMGGGIQRQELKEVEDKYKITIADPSKNARAEDRWLVDAQSKIDKQDSKITDAIQENQRLKNEIEKLKEQKNLQEEKFRQFEYKIDSLIKNIEKIKTNKLVGNRNNNSNIINKTIENSINNGSNIRSDDLIETINFEDEYEESELNSFNINDGYIPQASYVSAKIISSVDAQVGVSTQSNPKPVLLRINGEAKSALFNDQKLSINIQGCLVTAGAIGELSSEKIYIKLSKMTCANSETEVTEVPIKGYVAAKGSSGVRGKVVMKEGELIKKSFLSGVFGGIGSALSQSLAPPLTFGGGTTTQSSISISDATKSGVGAGLGNASDRLSDYLIKRAEQYQPVISIPSGIDVELVFIEGFYLDGRKKNNLNESSNNKDK